MSIRIQRYMHVQKINIHIKVSIELNIYTDIDINNIVLSLKMQHIDKA